MTLIRGDIIGGKELEAALMQLPKATAKNVLKRALERAAAPVVIEAESLAPRGPTGNLIASLDVSTKLKSSQKTGHPVGVELYIGAKTPPGYHAHLLEFGTAKMAARPFLRPAWDSTKQKVLSEISAEIWKALSKAARTLARKAAKGTLTVTARRILGG